MSGVVDRVRAGLVANIRSQIRDAQVGKYVLSAPTPPSIFIRHGGLEYDRAMGRGMDELTMIVAGFVHRDEGGQMRLDEWMDPGPGGLKAAIETDRSLGGSVNDCVVRSVAEPLIATVGAIDGLLAEWTVTVYPQQDLEA